MRSLSLIIALFALFAGLPVRAADAVTGHYRLVAGPDTAAQLVLHADGTFEYALAEGALDERAEGRWIRQGDRLALVTLPKPVPPVFRAAPRSVPGPSRPFLRVTSPAGRGIGGVDFRIGFDAGGPIEDYTQEDGWTMPEQEHRIPRWIELTEPIYGVKSPRYPIVAGPGTLTFIIVPNDIGVIDFSGVAIEILPDGLLVHRDRGDMNFVREPGGG